MLFTRGEVEVVSDGELPGLASDAGWNPAPPQLLYLLGLFELGPPPRDTGC